MGLSYLSRSFLLRALTVVLVFLGCSTKAETRHMASDFQLEDLSGNKVSLSEYRGYTVLLDFWATWCPPCRKSIPELVDLQNKYRDKGLVILGISLDDPQKINNKYLLAFKEKFKINYQIMRGDQKVLYDYFGNSNISIPTLFIINQEGRIVDKHVGFRPGAIERSLKKIIK
ncbi:TlpA disulfide reductase family protein [Thermodesulfobacteriota bacterium]